ncbi:MAG: T9SS type A sorting domain-containing protein [Bacteroidales bacterium]|nr:T9SS type A sorting domain-containing protein [Bacteroidales bacterium]MBN2820888.1 T9SS type A sorting domain-containing protein [Bacteroidales bacterium]
METKSFIQKSLQKIISSKSLFLVFFLLAGIVKLHAQGNWSFDKKFYPVPNYDNYLNHYGEVVDVSDEYIVVGSPNYKNSGCVYVLSNTSAYLILAILTPSDGEINDQFGNAVAIHGDTIVVGAKGHSLERGAVYVFQKPADGWISMTETCKLTYNDLGTNDRLGSSVAVSDNLIVAGSSGDDNNTGSAYVFTKNSGNWVDQSTNIKLTADFRSSNEYFGCSVDIHGDHIIVGAYGDYVDNFGNGAVYVFKKPVSGWSTMTETAVLTASDKNYEDNLGTSVAIFDSIIVAGAPKTDYDSYMDVGSVYVFKCPVSGWNDATESVKLTPFSKASNMLFGTTVDIEDDIILVAEDGHDYGNAKGGAYLFFRTSLGWQSGNENHMLNFSDTAWANYASLSSNTIVVGNKYDNKNGQESGSIYIYKKFGSWTTTTETNKQFPLKYYSNDYDHFGTSVAMNDKYIVIGQTDSHNSFKGKVYVISAIEPYDTIAVLTASDASSGLNLGCSVAIYDSVIVAGAFGDSFSKGAVYVFKQPAEGWHSMTESAKLTASVRSNYSYLGQQVSVYENTIVVGVDFSAFVVGKAYVFEKPAGGWTDMTETAVLTPSDGANDDKFGAAVSIYKNTIVIGSYKDDVGLYTNCGSAYVFEKPAGGWTDMTETAKLTATDASTSDYLGSSVDIEENTIVAGAYTAGSFGAAYVYEKPVSGWTDMTETGILTGDDFTSLSHFYFGKAVCIHDSVIVVGSEYNNENGTRSGAAYIFNRPASGWTDMYQNQKIKADDGESEEYFGYSVAMANNKLIIGARGDDDMGFESGSAYLYSFSCKTTSLINVSACDIYVSPSGNYTWTGEGIYTDTLQNYMGCDSIITINLSMRQTSYSSEFADECNVYISPAGNHIYASGVYQDTLQNFSGCDSIITLHVTIDTVDLRVNRNGNTLTALAEFATFQWVNIVDEGYINIEGANFAEFTPQDNGTYAVIVSQGSCIDISDYFVINLSGVNVNNTFSNSIRVFPNPTSGKLTIELNREIKKLKIIVTSATGQKIDQIYASNCSKIAYNLNGPKGLYIVKLIAENGETIHFNLIKE